jgi:uncharacterized protein
MSESIPTMITAGMKAAMKARDKPRLATLRMVRAGVIEAEKSGKEYSEADYQGMLRKMVKQRIDAADTYTKGGRQDMADAELYEVSVIEEFLPQLADESQTRAWVKEAIATSGATSPGDMGRVMGALMKAHKGEIDGGLARGIVSSELSA